jgi:ectoine hydroxylase-related dioxygenase (phytanoyl-CoA dioxygenase family)
VSIRADFEENGYVVCKGLFSSEFLAELQSDFDRIVCQLMDSGEEVNAIWEGAKSISKEGAFVTHTHNVQQFSSAWLRALTHEPFLDAARQILGDDIVLHHTKLFQKPGEKGAAFPMHQDYPYFPTEKDTMMAGVIHMSEADDEMGCFRVYPGTHKLGRVKDSHGQTEHPVLAKYPLEGSLALEAEPGDVVFFHYLLLHGSKPNSSQRVRKTVLVQMHAGDDRVEVGVPHTDEQLVLSGFNHRMTRERAGKKD